jgi:hypothetical protein
MLGAVNDYQEQQDKARCENTNMENNNKQDLNLFAKSIPQLDTFINIGDDCPYN